MQVIDENALENIHAPFHQTVRRWHAVKDNGDLPPLKKYLGEYEDELADFRMLSLINLSPLNIHYYQAGKILEDLYGESLSDKNLDKLYNNFFRKRAYEGYRFMIEAGKPVYEQRSFSTIIGRIGYFKLHLPFGESGEIQSAATYIMPTSNKFKRRFDWESLIKKTPWM